MSTDSTAGSVLASPRSALPPPDDLPHRLSASPLLVALDIDGTLAPIAPTPASAAIPDDTRRTLERLRALPNVQLAFVTGRAARDGRRLVNVMGSWTIGNHGIELIDPIGRLRVTTVAEAYAPAIAEAAETLREPLSRIDGVILENKTWTLSVHFRLARSDDVPNVERAVWEAARRLELEVTVGKMIFELRPPLVINKGTALLELATAVGVIDRGVLNGSLLYAGDDRTDEDAFRALPAPPSNAITLHVGNAVLPDGARTHAEFVLADTTAMHDFLVWLATTREAGGA